MDEYVAMFDLAWPVAALRYLDCGGGPSSFNAEMTREGQRVVSLDPLYEEAGSEISERITRTYEVMLQSVEAERGRFVWTRFRDPAHMGQERMAAMNAFLDDYDEGRAAGRYLPGSITRMPFDDGAFDVALCSHLLFLYSAQLSYAFHEAAILEMARVSGDVRIFPLLDLQGKPSIHVDPLIDSLGARGLNVTVRTVPYEFQKGGNKALFIQRN